ncbi:Sec-independent protein translocase subunit TatB [Candidatus Wolbachia massiliensis]|uniref:Sec-independent protein translocase protein TatB n=1 Tax=Candidatus Wolbachia massiliensis TaxID=1845000 RepID=A0A7M3U1W3_9RICK|nr:hypothetical protein [Candidatus Wolbachia massiliensis]QOD38398.1 hypothetical protein ID128_00545 [Candidatus Wolbachia massiliensis]
MFSIGLSEILVVILVSIVVLDKNKVPVFIDLIKNIYRYFMIIRSKARRLLKDAGIEDLYKEYDTEKVNYIVGKDGKLYPTYNIGNTSQDNDSKDPSSR